MCNLQPVSGQDRDGVADLDSQLQAQERIINISYALASEASQRSKQVAGEALGTASEAGPHPLLLGLRAWHGLSGSVEEQASGSLVEGQWYVPLSQAHCRACEGDWGSGVSRERVCSSFLNLRSGTAVPLSLRLWVENRFFLFS